MHLPHSLQPSGVASQTNDAPETIPSIEQIRLGINSPTRAALLLAESGYASLNLPGWIELTKDGDQLWVEIKRMSQP